MDELTLLVINANTSVSMTEDIGKAARRAASKGTEIIAVASKRGPRTIQGPVDSALSVPGMLEVAKECEGRYNGIISACFGDPGIDALRSAFGVPVVGILESAFHVASIAGNRFAVISPMQGNERRLRAFAGSKGIEDKLHSVLYAGVSIPDLESGLPDAEEHVYTAGKKALEKGADTLVFGCAGMSWVVEKIVSRFDVPCIDPVQAAVKTLESVLYFDSGKKFRGIPFQKDILGYPDLSSE
jgi:allantoin racemase